jgi:hypothetical protein
MGKRTVTLKFWEIDNPDSKKPSQAMKARLLGVLSSEEVAATLANFEIAEKLFTKPTINLDEAVQAIEELNSTKNSTNYGHLLFAAKEFNEVESYGKRLCITGAVDILNQTRFDKLTRLMDLDATLMDGTLINVKEYRKDE